MHIAVAQGPKAPSVLVDISTASGNFLCSSRYDNAFFYFLHQLVHSLSRFLSIFRKLVLTVAHHCGESETLHHAELEAVIDQAVHSGGLDYAAGHLNRLLPSLHQEPKVPARIRVSAAKQYLHTTATQCRGPSTSSVLPWSRSLQHACRQIAQSDRLLIVRANLQAANPKACRLKRVHLQCGDPKARLCGSDMIRCGNAVPVLRHLSLLNTQSCHVP